MTAAHEATEGTGQEVPTEPPGTAELPLVTKTGRVLTDDDIEALADEAGYPVERLTRRS